MARLLLALLAAAPALASAAVNLSLSLSTSSGSQECRCLPSDPCWPSADEWDTLNATVGGRLVATVPLASVCHDSVFGTYDEQACAGLRSVWDYPETHIASSSDPMAPFFANVSCDPFTAPGDQCAVGTMVQYAVNATCAADYQAAIAFAQLSNVRLVVRNTGHDYFGKSTGAGGLAIWTQHMKDIDVVDYDSWYYTGKALRVAAGVQNFEAQDAAHASGLAIVTGNCPTVGIAGGYTQGGGHGPLATKLGLAADQVLEWEVVTSTGEQLVASPDENPDLYWALTGGGGGTYAIVLSLTVMAYPDMPTSAANLTFTSQGVSEDVFYGAVQTFLTTLPDIVDSGAVTIFLLADGVFLMQPTTAPNVTKDELQTLLDPALNHLNQSGISYEFYIDQFSTFLDSYNAYNPPPNVTEYNIGGRLIPRTLVESDDGAASVVDAFKFIVQNGGVVSGVCVNVSNGTKVDNAVNPVWRESIMSAVIGLPYNPLNFQANIEAQANVTQILMPQLVNLSSVQGAYLNEADMHQPNWQEVFYNDNYETLKSIKDKYDPTGTLYGLTAVGSDDWTYDNSTGRLCRAS